MNEMTKTLRVGVIGGLGSLGSADVLLKTVRASQNLGSNDAIDISFDQKHFDDGSGVADERYNPLHRKFYVYNLLKEMQEKVDLALVPCFLSHTFISEITPEVQCKVVNMFDALLEFQKSNFPNVKKIGVLTSSYVRKTKVFDNQYGHNLEIVYPDQLSQEHLMEAIYGGDGIKNGHHSGLCIEQLLECCDNLISQGVELIIPGLTEIPVLLSSLQSLVPVPILDSNSIYAEYALGLSSTKEQADFKLGVLGGVGPAATVDFMRKIVQLTKAERDQDHIKIVVEQNPQIPDRTANILGKGKDPSISMLATCLRLQADGAHAIAIPCNTAHAFVEQIQRHLNIPIINMLAAVIDHINQAEQSIKNVGILATSGTIKSRVYHDQIIKSGKHVLAPSAQHQNNVMEAIYGQNGVKAGFISGECSELLKGAILHLIEKGAEAIILGCTELPLIELPVKISENVILLDPTEILARRCVELAQA